MRLAVVAIEPDRLAERRDGLVHFSLREQSSAKAAMAFGILRLEPERLAKSTHGLVKFVLLQKSASQVGLRLGLSGCDADRFTIAGDPVVDLAGLTECIAQDELSIRIIGRQPDRLPAFGNGLVVLALHRQGRPQVGVKLGITGFQPDRLAVLGNRQIALPDLFESISQREVALCVLGLERGRLTKLGCRLGQFPMAMQGRRQVRVGKQALGPQRHRRCTQPRGLCEFGLRQLLVMRTSQHHADPEIPWEPSPANLQDRDGARPVVCLDEHLREHDQAVHRLLFKLPRIGGPCREDGQCISDRPVTLVAYCVPPWVLISGPRHCGQLSPRVDFQSRSPHAAPLIEHRGDLGSLRPTGQPRSGGLGINHIEIQTVTAKSRRQLAIEPRELKVIGVRLDGRLQLGQQLSFGFSIAASNVFLRLNRAGGLLDRPHAESDRAAPGITRKCHDIACKEHHRSRERQSRSQAHCGQIKVEHVTPPVTGPARD